MILIELLSGVPGARVMNPASGPALKPGIHFDCAQLFAAYILPYRRFILTTYPTQRPREHAGCASIHTEVTIHEPNT